MMNCDEMEILLSAYIDGEVSEEERQDVEGHVGQCAHCQHLLADFETLHALTLELPLAEAPRGFRQRVTQRIEKRSTRRVFLFWRMPRLAYTLSAMFLLILFGVAALLYSGRVSEQTWQEQAALEVEVYAEDILFEDSSSLSSTEIFSEESSGVAEELLDSMYSDDTDAFLFPSLARQC